MPLNPMIPMQASRQALVDQINRSYFGFAPNGRPEQQALYAELRGHLVALVLDGSADEVLLEHPDLTAWAFFERTQMTVPEAADLATRLATASRRSRATGELASPAE